MFSVNFARFVRAHFIKKTLRTWEIHEDLQTESQKIMLKMRLNFISGRPCVFVRKDQNISSNK